MQIISDEQIPHKDTCGIRITRVQIIELDGHQFKCNFWHDLSNQKLIKIDSIPIVNRGEYVS